MISYPFTFDLRFEFIFWLNSRYKKLGEDLIFEIYASDNAFVIKISPDPDIETLVSLVTHFNSLRSNTRAYTTINKLFPQTMHGMRLHLYDRDNDYGETYGICESGEIFRISEFGKVILTNVISEFDEPAIDYPHSMPERRYEGNKKFIYQQMNRRFNLNIMVMMIVFILNLLFLQSPYYPAVNFLLFGYLMLWMLYDYPILHTAAFYYRFLVLAFLICFIPFAFSGNFIVAFGFPLIFLLIHKLLKTIFNYFMKRDPIIRYQKRNSSPTVADGFYFFFLVSLSVGSTILGILLL